MRTFIPRIRCTVCPRECLLADNGTGFCGVRKNVNGRIISLNYNKAAAIGIETIETEAIFHFTPASRILAVGNIGCNLTCDFCQNWITSQSQFSKKADTSHVTPKYIVDLALSFDIDTISWTYNEPVVWHEFVIDTSRLAREKGIKTLYKSSFYITEKSVSELLPVIDIFSISIKSLNKDFYKRLTGAELPPVLKATELVFASKKHLEISNLLIPKENTSPDDIKAISDWIVEKLSPDVPLHFVRFHPDYKYTDSTRTPVDMLIEAREIALKRGVKHVYLGNVSDTTGTDTICEVCGEILVRRFGTKASIRSLDDHGNCANCKSPSPIIYGQDLKKETISTDKKDSMVTLKHIWRGDINAIHIDIKNNSLNKSILSWRHINGSSGKNDSIAIPPGKPIRILVSKDSNEESGLEIGYDKMCEVSIFEVFDRAHLPTVSIMDATSDSDTTPMPFFNKTEFAGAK